MARGDVKYNRRRGRGYSGGSFYDDEGRGMSKSLWEKFQAEWEEAGYERQWLFGHLSGGLKLEDLYEMYYHMTERHTKHDWNDRVAGLVIKKAGPAAWKRFSTDQLAKAKEHKNDTRFQESIAYGIISIRREREMNAAQDKALQQLYDETEEMRQAAEFAAGSLTSDFVSAFQIKEIYDEDEGLWLDDPVSAYHDGHGFGDEIRTPSGVKLQIYLALDMSNSNKYNGIAEPAACAFRELGMALQQLQRTYPEDLFTDFFVFSKGEDGKRADVLDETKWTKQMYQNRIDNDSYLGIFEEFRPDTARFDGEDTWFYPLFDHMHRREQKYSDPEAYKLDLIISDAYIEHPTDIRQSSFIQGMRDGALTSIILNLLPEEEWSDHPLPSNCYMYPADINNLEGLLRILIRNFVQMHI